jgi:hypothetical protein
MTKKRFVITSATKVFYLLYRLVVENEVLPTVNAKNHQNQTRIAFFRDYTHTDVSRGIATGYELDERGVTVLVPVGSRILT